MEIWDYQKSGQTIHFMPYNLQSSSLTPISYLDVIFVQGGHAFIEKIWIWRDLEKWSLEQMKVI